MFTGLVETCGRVSAVQAGSSGKRITIAAPGFFAAMRIGDSVSLSGCCLTIVDMAGEEAQFDAGEETLKRTTIGHWQADTPVNLEKALSAGSPLGGHWLSGHVDAVGQLCDRKDNGQWSDLWFSAPRSLTRQMASKGSIGVDGVSLTLVDVKSDSFSVALIPHTLSVTTMGSLRLGDAVNLETDILAKYVESQLRAAGIIPQHSAQGAAVDVR